MKIENAVAIVTGGASGLGEATVREYVNSGVKVSIWDMNAERGKAISVELGDAAIFIQTDVTDENQVTAAIEKTIETFGKISVAVNCAGIATAEKTVGKEGPHTLASFQRTININLIGSFNVARLAAAEMQKNEPNEDGERGVIVNTASIAAFDGQKGQVAYAGSKGGVVGMVLPMARDLANQGVRVNAIAPGLFMTPMMAGLPEAAREALSQQPLFPKRLGNPAEFGKLAKFLVECPYMNGETVRLDGGIRLPQ